MEIPWDNDYKVPTKKVNESLSFDATEAVRTCKYGIYGHSTEKERQERKEAIHTLSKNHPDTVGTTIFLPEEAEMLMEKYLDGNRRIEEEYCDVKPLFSDEFNKAPIRQPNRLRIAKYRAGLLFLRLLKKLRLFEN